QVRVMWRLPGLFDTPGAVAGPAAFAALLGLIFAVSAISAWKRVLSVVFAGAGLSAIYLSQVRVSLVIAIAMMGAYAFVATRQGRVGRATQFLILAGGLCVAGFTLALTLGGLTISQRFLSRVSAAPLSVYRGARGAQLDVTFGELFTDHPLASGLGGWGMAASYFGTMTSSSALWAEIQLTGWMIDGGILMIALYVGAIVVT